MNSSTQIRLGVLMSYAAIIFNIVAGLIYTPWMIKQIGISDFGLFVLVGSFLSYFVMDFGLGSAIARFIAKYRAEGLDEAVSELLGLTIKIYILIDFLLLLILVALYFFIENIFVKLSLEEVEKFKVIFCIAGLYSVISFPFMSQNSVLIAYEHFFVLKFCDLLNKIFTVSLMVVALMAGYKLYALVAVNAAVGLIIIIIKYSYLSKKIPLKVNYIYFDFNVLKELVMFSGWVTLVGIAQRLLITITPTILGIFSGPAEIAVFSIGLTIEAYTWMLATALGGLFLPKVTHLIANGNREEVGALMVKIGRLQLFIIGIVVIGFITLGKEFIFLWVGEDFKNSYLVALLLIVPKLITSPQEIAYTLLSVENKIKYWAMLFLCASVLSICISVLLSPKYGAIGSSLGIFIALFLCHIVGMNIVFVRVLRLDIKYFFKQCHMKFLLPFLLIILIGYFINIYIEASSIITFLPKAMLLFIIYVTILWFSAFNVYEKALINGLFQKINSFSRWQKR